MRLLDSLGVPKTRREGLGEHPAIHSIMRRRQQLDAEIKSHKQLTDALTKQFVASTAHS
jgi:hypothetical protein